ncbi:hypothetical protein Trydic_g5152 [Trypoxylus dichotomus]
MNSGTLEDCLVHLRNYDNHKQQVHFLNFIRQKGEKPRNSPVHNKIHYVPAFHMQNRPDTFQAHRMPQRPENQQTFTQPNRTCFPTGPVNVFGKSAPNTQFGKANKNQQLPKPTPMSVSTTRTAKPNSNFARRFNNNNNFFRSTGPRDIIVEELHNVEEPPNFDEFNDQSHEYEFESESFDPQNSYYENETPEENFQLIASEEPPLT